MVVRSPSFPKPWELSESQLPVICPVCGEQEYTEQSLLWPTLISAWQLEPDDVKLIDRQQGLTCRKCHCNLRTMTLAGALNCALNWNGTLHQFISTDRARQIHLLEVNEAGSLHEYLRLFPGHSMAQFPQVDIQNLPFSDGSFDVVLHSDTLEHVPDPIQGLRECRRVLRPGGVLIMTIPILSGRLSRRCPEETPSYHSQGNAFEDWLVRTEYGADFYLDFIAAGWNNVAIFTLGGAAAFAVIGIKHHMPWGHLVAGTPTLHPAPPSYIDPQLRQSLREARNNVRLAVRRGIRFARRLGAFASRFSPL
jgi:SAM-dependent methyltransferase